MHSISPFGWALLILLALFIISLNISLFVGVKKQNNKDHWTHKISEAWHVMRDPLKKESDRYEELSEKVKQLKEKDQKQ